MEFKITVFSKEYDCQVVEQAGRAKGTRYKAYGYFDDKFIDAQASSIPSAISKLKRKAEIVLDY